MKTCNLYTVKNTPSEARRNTSSVIYYYIDFDFERDDVAPNVPTWRTLRGVIETIWDTLSVCDLTLMDGHYICAYMTNGTTRKVRYIRVDDERREMIISRV